jgi:hypothetical protein
MKEHEEEIKNQKLKEEDEIRLLNELKLFEKRKKGFFIL